MTLGQLIERLEALDQSKVCKYAFAYPHSWRGVYAELAFEPAENRTVGEMLADARRALGATYEGYKGGTYPMDENTEIHIERYGTAEDLLYEYGVRWMLES